MDIRLWAYLPPGEGEALNLCLFLSKTYIFLWVGHTVAMQLHTEPRLFPRFGPSTALTKLPQWAVPAVRAKVEDCFGGS